MVEKQTRSINRSVPVPGLSHKPHVCPAPHSSSPLKPELGPPPSYTGGKSGGPCQATLVDCPSVRVYGCPQELRMCFLAMVVPLSSALQENSRISKQHRQALWQTHPWAVSPGAPRGGTQPGGNGHPYQGLGFLPGACALPQEGLPLHQPLQGGRATLRPAASPPSCTRLLPQMSVFLWVLFLGNWRLLDHRDSALSLNSLLLPS